MITADMTIASVMKLDPEVAPVFMSYGMHCLYCPHASAESIAEASQVHGINADELVKALNAFFDAKKLKAAAPLPHQFARGISISHASSFL